PADRRGEHLDASHTPWGRGERLVGRTERAQSVGEGAVAAAGEGSRARWRTVAARVRPGSVSCMKQELRYDGLTIERELYFIVMTRGGPRRPPPVRRPGT